MTENRNLFVAVALSALFMLAWWKFIAEPQTKAQQQRAQAVAAQQAKKPAAPSTTIAAPPPSAAPAFR